MPKNDIVSILICLSFICPLIAKAETAENPGRTSHLSVNETVHEVTLDSLRDTWLSLNEIRQQTIYIFVEATRAHYKAGNQWHVNLPKFISLKCFDAKKNYMSPRPEWLWYYVGNMEPIIQLFQDDVNDTAAGAKKLLVPANTRENLHPLWKEWLSELQALNEHLTKLNNILNDKKIDNQAVAIEAIEMFNVTENMEKTRQAAFKVIRDAKPIPDGAKTEL